MIGHDIPAGSYVNLGIGQPTKIADYLPADEDGNQTVILHTENGMLGMGPTATGDEVDPDLTNAGKIPVTELPGAAYFHHADSFAMMRGGHLDVCVLGAYQVSASGDLANWHTGRPEDIPAVGGAMDLAIGAKDVYVMMTLFTKKGEAKLVPGVHVPAHRRRLRQPGLHRLRRLRHPAGRRARPGHLRHHASPSSATGCRSSSSADVPRRLRARAAAVMARAAVPVRRTAPASPPRPRPPPAGSARGQPERARPRHPGQVQVLRVGIARRRRTRPC